MPTYHYNLPPEFADKLAQLGFQGAQLENAARRISLLRLGELRETPISGSFDLEHLCATHQYIFQDISSYAGSVRRYGLKRTDSDLPFARPWEITNLFSQQVARITGKIQESNDTDYFVVGCAHVFNALNYGHPFADGNGRSARELIEVLANSRGLSLNLETLSRQDKALWNQISEQGRRGDPQGLIDFFRRNVQLLPLSMHEHYGVVNPLPAPACGAKLPHPQDEMIYPEKSALERYLQKQNKSQADKGACAPPDKKMGMD